MKIPITKPVLGDAEKQAILQPLETGWVVQGPFVQEFERRIARFVNSEYAVAASNCTAALHIAVAALGLQPGDEVIVPAFTWVATANVVEYMGAKPVFCDINLDTFNIDCDKIEALVSPKTVGIIPVHLFGLPAGMPVICDLAHKHGLWIVEDCACALGAGLGGKHVGMFGDCGCFSFHPRKCITTGEGGMLVTDDPSIAEKAVALRNHGASVSDFDRHHRADGFRLAAFELLGYNYRMTDLQGALGAAQMQRLSEVLEERRARALRYRQLLANVNWLRLPPDPSEQNARHAYQSFVCLFAPEVPSLQNLATLGQRRDKLLLELEARGVSTRAGTHAPPLQSYYSKKYGYTPENFPQAAIAERLSFALPLFPQMTDAEQDYVVEMVRDKKSWVWETPTI